MRRTKLIFPLIILSLEDGFDAVDSEPTNVFNNHPVYRFSDPYKFLRNNYGVVAVSIFIYQVRRRQGFRERLKTFFIGDY